MQRGPVEIKGVTTRTNERSYRKCKACPDAIALRAPYERVARLGGSIESYHQHCFIEEFGPREAYGD